MKQWPIAMLTVATLTLGVNSIANSGQLSLKEAAAAA